MANKYRTIESGIEVLREASTTSSGVSNAGEIVALNSNGDLDKSLLPSFLKTTTDFGGTQISLGDRVSTTLLGAATIRLGHGSLEKCPSATESVVIGTNAGYGATPDDGPSDGIYDCVLIGHEVSSFQVLPYSGVPMVGTTAVGFGSLFACRGDYNTSIGYSAGSSSTVAKNCLYLGAFAGQSNDTDDRLYIAGFSSGQLITGQFDNGKVGINIDANSIPSCASFAVASTTGGFLPPRMTTTQRNALTSPVAGLQVYNTTTSTPQSWNGSTWTDMVSGGSSALVIATITANHTITNEDVILCNASSPITVTLPLTCTRRVTIKQIGSADATVSGGTIDGDNILRGGTKNAMTIIFDLTQWWNI